MKKSIYIFAGVALSCMLMSCEDINEGGVDRHPQLPVKLKASITPFEQEKPETWKGEEEFGVFMFPSGEEKGFASSKCVRFKTDAEGELSITETGTELMYPKDAAKVDFICFTPFEESALTSRALSLDVSTREKALACDYLYSDNSRNKYPALAPVKIQMKHVLSAVRFEITAEDDILPAELKNLNPQMEGVNATGSFNLGDATLTPSGTATAIPMLADEGMTSADCLLLPATSNVTVRCNVAGQEFRKKLGDLTFERGKLYIFDLHVSHPGFEISLREIEDWVVETYD